MSDLRDTITNAAKTAAKTSGDLLKSAKLNMNLSSAESSLKNLHSEIGKKVHEIYQNGGSLGEWFDGKYLEILETENKISEIKEQLDELKGVRKCPKCEKTSDRTSEFCSKCGMRFPIVSEETVATEAEIPPEPQQEEPPDIQRMSPPPTKKCRVCSTENEMSTKFCFSCGRILD
ncbi:MAG: zinc ribbon domain-containing protein [Defluviitaleaceae bacterium]|nr:zinc ribbon domain-containing protein [Defluviitaleaceae bacterium]